MRFSEFLYKHPLLTFMLMVVSGLTVGTLTVNIFYVLSQNWEFISRHGLMALREGAGLQLLELVFTGTVSMFVFILFKVTESVLVEWLKNRTRPGRNEAA
ncbi:MAG: hypothetical protein KDJ38_08025 [Gammaproteobacteria bacterium]|nr:hypothetical protein [Gammaproteobacteria bacterium]